MGVDLPHFHTHTPACLSAPLPSLLSSLVCLGGMCSCLATHLPAWLPAWLPRYLPSSLARAACAAAACLPSCLAGRPTSLPTLRSLGGMCCWLGWAPLPYTGSLSLCWLRLQEGRGAKPSRAKPSPWARQGETSRQARRVFYSATELSGSEGKQGAEVTRWANADWGESHAHWIWGAPWGPDGDPQRAASGQWAGIWEPLG